MTPCADLLAKKAIIDHCLSRNPQALSSFSFAAIFAWKDFYRFECKVIEGFLCVFAGDAMGTFLFLPPLAEDAGQRPNLRVIEKCFDRMMALNRGRGVSRVENVPESMLEHFPAERFFRFQKNYEYCYFRKDLQAMKGNPYKSQRAEYNYFLKHSSAHYQEYRSSMLSECLGLYRDWAKRKRPSNQDPVYRQMLDDNETVHRSVLEHYEQLGLTGRAVLVNDRVKAYSFGYRLSSEIFCILFEIADLSLKGLPVFIFRRFCSDKEIEKFKFINAMDDFALENVARTKMGFRPAVLVSSYGISLKS